MDKQKLYDEAKLVIDSMLQSSELLNLDSWDLSKTAVVVIDMINGFAKSGNLYSDRVKYIISNNIKVLESVKCQPIFLCDRHPVDAEEFNDFLLHCQIDSGEENIIDELKVFADRGLVIHKNSTNGFIEPVFQQWLHESIVDSYIITGCCTDLCVIQFVLSLKTHYNRINKPCKIAVIENAVDTYDINAISHPGDFSHIMSLKMMKDNGILLRRI